MLLGPWVCSTDSPRLDTSLKTDKCDLYLRAQGVYRCASLSLIAFVFQSFVDWVNVLQMQDWQLRPCDSKDTLIHCAMKYIEIPLFAVC